MPLEDSPGGLQLGPARTQTPDGGAITAIGATRPSWSIGNWDPETNNLLDAALATRFWQVFFDPAQGNFRAGPALNRAKDWFADRFRQYLNDPKYRERVGLMAYVITGDPESRRPCVLSTRSAVLPGLPAVGTARLESSILI